MENVSGLHAEVTRLHRSVRADYLNMATNRVIRRNPTSDFQPVIAYVPATVEIKPAEATVVSVAAEIVAATRAAATVETSSNRYRKQTVAPRKDLIRFSSGERKATNRKRRASLNRGGMLFTDRDRDLLQLVVAFGWLSKRNLGLLVGTKPRNLERRLAQLVAFGLLNDRSRGFASETLYTVTRLTLRWSGMGTAEGFRMSRPSAQVITHSDALVACCLRFQEGNSGSVFVTEREVAAAAASGILSARIQSQAPWAQQQFAGHFKSWILDAGTIAGKESGGVKRPDGLLLTQGKLPQAIEMEVTKKTTLESYRRFLLAYDDAILKSHLQPTVYVITGEVTDATAAIRTSITNALKILTQTRKPTVKIQFAVLDTARWSPTAAKAGWFPPAK